MARPLDDRDRKILAALKADAWLTYPALGERVSLSASAVQRRVERLIREGVILGAHAQVARQPTPEGVSVCLLAELSDESTEALAQITQVLSGLPQVVNAHYVAGEADLAMWLEFADIAEYNLFLESHINRWPLIRKFKTLVVLRTLKSSGATGDIWPEAEAPASSSANSF
jgi:Lrp/AsnC family leucine-responsive transcriptional regulator